MAQLKLFKIRDLRKKEQFIIDDAYLNSWAKYCGTSATLVYLSLCRHADKEQKAFPSQQRIADELGIHIRSVRRGIKKLLEYNIIQVEQEREKGKFTNYLYYLVDKSEWKQPPRDKKCLRSHQRTKTDGGPPTYGKVPTKDAHFKDAHFKDNEKEKINNKKEKENLERLSELKKPLLGKMTFFTPQERTQFQEEAAAQIRPSGLYSNQGSKGS